MTDKDTLIMEILQQMKDDIAELKADVKEKASKEDIAELKADSKEMKETIKGLSEFRTYTLAITSFVVFLAALINKNVVSVLKWLHIIT